MLKRFATLLPNNWLAEIAQAHALMRLGRQSAERDRVSEISGSFKKKNCRQTHFRNCLQAKRERV
ncbi:hypothetical protein [Peribacillus frigoritolerans]|uniref:Uncharacterized protein n=1 Tax=Peribacillus castrilensis TaxID=2897690 RepID=A0AAW9NCJ8_9BACI|nr:hypothetical protein [Peribacillus castrilensis]